MTGGYYRRALSCAPWRGVLTCCSEKQAWHARSQEGVSVPGLTHLLSLTGQMGFHTAEGTLPVPQLPLRRKPIVLEFVLQKLSLQKIDEKGQE